MGCRRRTAGQAGHRARVRAAAKPAACSKCKDNNELQTKNSPGRRKEARGPGTRPSMRPSSPVAEEGMMTRPLVLAKRGFPRNGDRSRPAPSQGSTTQDFESRAGLQAPRLPQRLLQRLLMTRPEGPRWLRATALTRTPVTTPTARPGPAESPGDFTSSRRPRPQRGSGGQAHQNAPTPRPRWGWNSTSKGESLQRQPGRACNPRHDLSTCRGPALGRDTLRTQYLWKKTLQAARWSSELAFESPPAWWTVVDAGRGWLRSLPECSPHRLPPSLGPHNYSKESWTQKRPLSDTGCRREGPPGPP